MKMSMKTAIVISGTGGMDLGTVKISQSKDCQLVILFFAGVTHLCWVE